MWAEVGERGLVQQRGAHHPTFGEVIDDQIGELDLIGAERLTSQEVGERLLRRASVESDQ